MDDFDINKIPSSSQKASETIPFDNDISNSNVSHSPLNLGGSGTAQTQVVKEPGEKMVSSERITGLKTFFTKLHAGSIDFLSTQITEWLKKNPGVVVKRTNVVTGIMVAKKTEPSIIITIWY